MSAILEALVYPQALALLAALPVLALGALLGWFARRRGLRLMGSLHTRTAWSAGLFGRRFFRGLLIGAGLLLVVVATAGPRWGREKTEVVSAARDLVVLLDVSRSMLAETPSRQLRAQRVLDDLATTLKQRGGHRVALVIVAARAQVVMPLTADYDLFQTAIWQQNAARLPVELRPGKDGPASGTRLGEGLKQAVATHDPGYRGSQVILLVSDGDDPAGDGEWKEGVVAARRASIPVFVVGVGNATKPSKIRIGDLTLKFGDEDVQTTLNEEVLQDIAKRTDGAYFPVRTENVVPGTLFPAVLQAAAALPRETPPAEDAAKQYRWFLVAGLILLMASLLIREPAITLEREIVVDGVAWSRGRRKKKTWQPKPAAFLRAGRRPRRSSSSWGLYFSPAPRPRSMTLSDRGTKRFSGRITKRHLSFMSKPRSVQPILVWWHSTRRRRWCGSASIARRSCAMPAVCKTVRPPPHAALWGFTTWARPCSALAPKARTSMHWPGLANALSVASRKRLPTRPCRMTPSITWTWPGCFGSRSALK